MPEGDTIFRAARIAASRPRRPRRHAVRHRLRASRSRQRRHADRRPHSSSSAKSAGKHLLMCFSGDLILRTHMRMNGSWHLYRHGERWWRGPHAMRMRIDTADWVAVAFDVPVAEFVTPQAAGDARSGRAARARPARRRPSIATRPIRRIVASGASADRARRCSISASSPASATSTSPKCCSCRACIPTRRRARCRSPRSSG